MTDGNNSDLIIPKSLQELASLDLLTLKSQEIGLNLLILQMANRESKRIQRLSTVIDALEEKIFDPDLLDHLTPSEQMERYTLAMEITQRSNAYVAQAVKAINWQDIETKILILQQEDSNKGTDEEKVGSSDLQSAAIRLLQQLSVSK